MADFVTFGDAEAAVCDILRAHTALSGVTVSTDRIGYTSAATWVQVTRTGGAPTMWMNVDNPVLTVDVYAPTKLTAWQCAVRSRAAVFAACGQYSGHGLSLYDVTEADGLRWDAEEPGHAHYTFGVALVTRPI